MLENDNNVQMNEITVNTSEERKGKIKKQKKSAEKDIWDYIILEVGIACGIMLVLLAVNCIGIFGGLGIASIGALFTGAGTLV